MKRKEGKFIYCDEYADGTLRVTIIENVDTLSKGSDKEEKEFNDLTPDPALLGVRSEDGIYSDEFCLLSSVSRSRNKIYDIVHSMDVEWFGTFTVSPEFWVDRKDREAVKKYCGKWFHNLRKRKCPNIQYICIPEPHIKPGFHLHLLMSHCDGLTFDYSGKHDWQNRKVYNLREWTAGWSHLTRATTRQAVSNYIQKYITKDLLLQDSFFGKHRYISSQNIPKPIRHYNEFIPLGNNIKHSKEDFAFDIACYDENKKLAFDIVETLKNEFIFKCSKNLDMDSGDFSFHSTRFFFEKK